MCLTAALNTSESRDGATEEQSREGGGASVAMQDVRGAVFANTWLSFNEKEPSWQLSIDRTLLVLI